MNKGGNMSIDSRLVTWSSTYSVGIKIIDEQHKKLLDLVNDMFNHVVGNEAAERAYFKKIIRQAVEYIKVHFSTEEKILIATKFPGYAEHKKSHDTFILAVVDNIRAFDSGKKMNLCYFTHFLKDWVLTHIAIMDKEYFDFLKKNALRKKDAKPNNNVEEIAC